MQTWQMQAAKARFSDVVKRAADSGPQEITVHGRAVAVVVSRELFDHSVVMASHWSTSCAIRLVRVRTTSSLSVIAVCRARLSSKSALRSAKHELPDRHQRLVRVTPQTTR